MTTAKFQLEPLSCPSCIRKIETTLTKMDGVKEVSVLFNSSKVKVTYDQEQASSDQLKETIEKLGYPVLS
ncbi:heavy-metal-associated domain-containing protein [Amphibacillus sp. Q70]|uniref:heavy-metal-associated domain-containing protein n=1 Tax=Amphibacillus sp. Q70 TaxID=3453416 RepID=UPI003F856A7D